VKRLEVAVGNDGDSEGGVLAAVLGDAAGGCVADGPEEGDALLSLHSVSPFARSIGTHPKGRGTTSSERRAEGALLHRSGGRVNVQTGELQSDDVSC